MALSPEDTAIIFMIQAYLDGRSDLSKSAKALKKEAAALGFDENDSFTCTATQLTATWKKTVSKEAREAMAFEETAASQDSDKDDSSDPSDVEMATGGQEDASEASDSDTSSDDEDGESKSEPESDSGSDSDSADSDSEDSAPGPVQEVVTSVSANNKKRKLADRSDDSSSASSASDASSDEDDSSDDDAPPTKKVKTSVAVPVEVVVEPESASPESDSSSQSSSADSDANAASSNSDSSSEADSDSDSDSSSDSSSESSDSDSDTKTVHKSKILRITQSPSRDDSSSQESVASSVTLVASSPEKSSSSSSAIADSAIHPDRQQNMPGSAVAEDAQGSAKSLKKRNVPFSRIPADQKVDPRLASNTYVPYDYANQAHEKLIVTKGKGFTKAKNKGKRGSYRGGMIEMGVNSFKFED